MTPEKWEKVKSLFATVQEMPEGKRRKFLYNASGGDKEISGEVIKLLDSYSEDDEFLEISAVAEVASMLEEDDSVAESGGKKTGPRFAKDRMVDGRYKIIQMLGKGGMGEVYLAHDTNLDRKVALKVLPAELTESKTRLQRFEREARAVSALNHPHILTIFEFGESGDGDHYIVSEFVEGKTLNELNDSKILSLNKILDITLQVASALSASHEAGITHRDIKPDNIMVRNDGYVKVLDFGLAKLTEPDHVESADPDAATRAMIETAPGSVMGTAAYMSPEQARGLAVDARTDIWSLGVVIYELLTGQQPFRGNTSTDTIIAVIKKDPVPIRAYVENLPSEIEWVVLKTLSKELDGRYQTAKELSADIAKIKKRVEFADEVERTSQPVKNADGSEDSPTIIFDKQSTKLKHAETTRELTNEGRTNTADRASSFEYVVVGAARHKILSAVIAVVFAAILSIAAYYIFFATPVSDAIDSIAVLPFENVSGDPKLAYLSEGISENLIDRLSQLPNLKVIARSSSWKFQDKNADIQTVANQLGVRVIVSGKIIRIGDKLSIRIDVIDAPQNKQLWGATYERSADDILSVQNEISGTISDSLRLKLTAGQEKRLANGGTSNSDAFRYYLNGLVELRGPDDIRGKALDYFLKAVEIDPNFAQAYASLALVYSDRAIGTGNPSELMPKARAAAEKALEIDPELAQAHIALAAVREYEFDWKGADKSYRRAIELNPNLDIARDRYGFFLSVMGRHNEALQQIEQALLRDPINVWLHLNFKGMNQIQARKFDDALKTLEEAVRSDKNASPLDFDFGYAYGGKGMYKQSAEYFKRSVDSVGGENKYSQSLVYLAAAYARIPEKRAEAVKIAERLETSSERVSPALLAIIYEALGENEKAIEKLEKAYTERDSLLRYIGVGYEYDGLRSDPRFKDLLKRTGLEESTS